MNDEIEKLKEWANSKDCECELSHETFMKCCGKKVEEVMDILIKKEPSGPRFRDLSNEAQLKILNLVAGIE